MVIICALTVFTESHESARERRQASKSSFVIDSIVGSGISLAKSNNGERQFFTASLSWGGRKELICILRISEYLFQSIQIINLQI
jgi:hypothetical protein